MPTSVEKAPETDREEAPDWSPLPDPATAESRPAVAAAWRAAAGLAVCALLWWLGHRLPAVVLLVVLALATAASLFFPPVALQLDRATRAIQRVAGRILGFMLLGAVQLLVFTPASLVLWLVRRDPLAPPRPRDEPSLWRPTPRRLGRPLYRRQFTYERPAADGSGGLPRWRAALGIVALVVLIDVVAGLAIHALDRAGEAPTDTSARADQAAGRAEPWTAALEAELDQVWDTREYDPNLGWATRDFDGTYVHVADGMRRSYQPADGQARDAVEVFFFGGSALFGVQQRDQHTIPSEIARLAEADGIPVRVSNYGQQAWVNWQEMLLLEQLLSSGRVPDLAVFYDGFNELLSQFHGPRAEPSHVFARRYAERLGIGQGGVSADDDSSRLGDLYRSWKEVSASVWLSRRVRGLPTESDPETESSPGGTGDQKKLATVAGRNAASVHARGVTMARRIGNGSGIRSAFFWQPSLFTKRLASGEANLNKESDVDPETWRRGTAVARSKLRSPVVDIGDALDSVAAPVMYDSVHTNERGAMLVARALYRRLAPTLRELHRRERR